jgi:tetratricopeptide (TPR) repeat protein
MTGRRLTAGVGAIAAAVALLAEAVQLQAARERAYPAANNDVEAMYLRSGQAIRRLTGAYTALAADGYWIRAIQYYGGTKRRLQAQPRVPEPPPMLAVPTSSDYSLLYPMLDIATTLDPRFTIAYRFGSVFLAEAYPRGPGRPDLAVALLEKGLRAQPDKWEYMEDIGFVHYWYAHDYGAASRWFEKASEVNGAPWWLRSLAATTLAQGGDRQSSRVMWDAIRQSAEIDWLRQDAERRLLQLDALDQIDKLQKIVDAFARGASQPPAGWQSLVRARVLPPGVPVDPTRTPYELTPEGRVHISAASPLAPLPEEPRQTVAPQAPPRP